MELWDIYDIDRVRTGKTMVRGEPTPDGALRLVIHVCIFNRDGKMLIQQRQPFKKGWSGMWDMTVGGHAVAGDDSRTAAMREVKEELGLDIDLEGQRPAVTINWEKGFDDVFIVNMDVDTDKLSLQQEEVCAVKWADIDEIKSMIDGGSFIPYHKGYMEMLFHLKDRRSTHTDHDRSVPHGKA